MRSCEQCGAELTPTRRRFCRNACAVRYNNEVARWLRRDGVTRQQLKEQRGPCPQCDGPIPAARRLGVRYCSEKCRKAATYNPAKWRDANLRKLYGVSAAEVEALLAMQGGLCAVCRTDDWQDGAPHVDHDHETGVVRGVLCQSCNHGLGKFRDDPDRLRAAADYLENAIHMQMKGIPA